jgi:hypothetical protein
VAVNLDELTKSLNETGAVERLNDLVYYLALVSNGFDGLGHYLRAGLVTNVCSSYALEPSPSCRSTFFDPSAEGATASGEPLAATNAEVTKGSGQGSVAPTGSLLQDLLGQGGDPSVGRRREQNLEALQQRHRRGRSPALEEADPALEYLLGGEEG